MDDVGVKTLPSAAEVLWSSDGSGHIYPKTATDDLYIGGAAPNGVWFDDGDLVLGAAAMSNTEKLRVAGHVLVDSDGQILIADSATQPPLNITERATAPSSPATGDIYLDDGSNTASGGPGWRRYNGATWEDISAGAGSSGGWTRDAGGFIYATTATDDLYIGGSTPNGVWFDDGDLVLGGLAMVGAEKLLVVGSHLIDQNSDAYGLGIDSEATGSPLINLQPINGNSRGDIAFGTARTADPSAPSEGDLWYEATSEELKFRKSAATVEVRDAYKLQGRSVAATAPTDGQVLTWNGTGTQWEPQAAPGPYSNIAEANGDITTTSTTDVLATGMTITPPAGTYMVWFSSSVSSDTNNAEVWASIYSGGTQVSGSERELMRGAAQGNVAIGFACVARVTVNGAQAIEGRWRVTASSTGTMESGRTLSIIRVTT
jgi:hypothetical protein